MKSHRDWIFISSILVEVLLLIITLTCLIIHNKKSNKSNTIVVVEPHIESVSSEIDKSINTYAESINLMLTISKGKCSLSDAIDIYSETINSCIKYSVPLNFILGIEAQESNFIHTARNKKTNATGLMQICPSCLDDYNRWNGTNYKIEDMFDIHKNIEVGVWNFKQQAYYLRNEPIVTYSDLIIAFNTGIGNFKKYKNFWYDGWNPIHEMEYKYLDKVVGFSNQFISVGDLKSEKL